MARSPQWTHDVWSFPHSTRPGSGAGCNLRSAWYLADPVLPAKAVDGPLPNGAAARNAVPIYAAANQTVTSHYLAAMPIRTSALRTLGGYFNVVSAEMFVDELAAMSGRDPVAFRLANVKDPRLVAVLKKARGDVGLDAGRGRKRPLAPEMIGTGVGLSRYKNSDAYVAVVAEVSVDTKSGRVSPLRMWSATDAGRAVNPDGVLNQIDGGMAQATSWTLQEAGRWDSGIMTAVDYGALSDPGLRHHAGHDLGGDRSARSALARGRRGQPGAGGGGDRQRHLRGDRPARQRRSLSRRSACWRRCRPDGSSICSRPRRLQGLVDEHIGDRHALQGVHLVGWTNSVGMVAIGKRSANALQLGRLEVVRELQFMGDGLLDRACVGAVRRRCPLRRHGRTSRLSQAAGSRRRLSGGIRPTAGRRGPRSGDRDSRRVLLPCPAWSRTEWNGRRGTGARPIPRLRETAEHWTQHDPTDTRPTRPAEASITRQRLRIADRALADPKARACQQRLRVGDALSTDVIPAKAGTQDTILSGCRQQRCLHAVHGNIAGNCVDQSRVER